MKKRILIDLLNLATPDVAGVGVFARNLFEGWLGEDNVPYVIVFYSSYVVDAEKVFRFKSSENIIVKKIGIKHVLSRFIYQQVFLPFTLRKYDLYYNPTLGIPFLARIIARKTKLVVTIHDMIPFFYPKKYSPIRSVLVKVMSKQAARVAHKLITVSENSKKDIVEIASVPHAKVVVVYNYISTPYELDINVDEHFFLCISTLEPGKNVENTIRGFGNFLRRTGALYKFYWVGRIGWVYSHEYLTQLIRNENLVDSFILMGYLNEEKKRNLLRACTAVVYLSHYEGFGLPVLEGMTFNKVAIASNNSSLPEVVGEAGVLCNPLDLDSIADAMAYTIANRGILMKMIPAQLAKFSPSKQVSVFKQTLQDVLN